MPPTGMPTNRDSGQRTGAGAPRAKREFTQSGSSFLSAGTSRSKSARVNGPAMTGMPAIAAPIAARPDALRNARRASGASSPHPQPPSK